MFLLSIVFGLTLAALLPWRRTAAAREGQRATPATGETTLGRRDLMKGLGGGVLALVGGVALWFAIRAALEPPPVAGPQPVETEPQGTNPSPSAVAQASPQSTHIAEMEATPDMTEVPATPPVPPGFEGVKPVLVPEI